jgi:UDP-N-acetylglucosamine--N-acetylmuramyl-(pentapeptide) pyrophosphoryl-undecaprenol N-acetylglucosamine transferase
MKSLISTKKKIMIMAAGTGGHIFPGLAIAKLMQARGWDVVWLGTQTGMEGAIVKNNHIAIDQLDFTGLRGKGWKHSLAGAFKLVKSFFTCISLMRKHRPDVVLGMGGYVTVPGGIACALTGKSLVLMNADADLLMSNKALKPFAKKVILGLPSKSIQQSQAEYIGNPIRAEICNLPEPQQRYSQRSGALNLVVIGGSLGAKVLNETVPAALALIPESMRPNVRHQSGKQHIQNLQQRYLELGVKAETLDFIDDMRTCYADADLIICRAGAITLSELTAAGVASILVPLVASSTSHQQANAEWIDEHQAGIHLPQKEMNAQALADLILSLTRSRCMEMAESAYALGRRQASENIATILEEML